jgi:hypothetical protein
MPDANLREAFGALREAFDRLEELEAKHHDLNAWPPVPLSDLMQALHEYVETNPEIARLFRLKYAWVGG